MKKLASVVTLAVALSSLGIACSSPSDREGTSHTQSGLAGDDCFTSDDCDDGEYCATDAAMCGGIGTCAAKQGDCAAAPARPVCACDGNTYASACLAAQAGFSVDYDGACVVPCVTNDDCGPMQFCETAEGACGAVGECRGRALMVMCVTTKAPLCGCDGVTYQNTCYAHKAGAAVDHAGACSPQAQSR